MMTGHTSVVGAWLMGRAANVGVANVRHSLCLGSKSASRGEKSHQCDNVSKVTGEGTGPYEAARKSYQCDSVNVVEWEIEPISPRK